REHARPRDGGAGRAPAPFVPRVTTAGGPDGRCPPGSHEWAGGGGGAQKTRPSGPLAQVPFRVWPWKSTVHASDADLPLQASKASCGGGGGELGRQKSFSLGSA